MISEGHGKIWTSQSRAKRSELSRCNLGDYQKPAPGLFQRRRSAGRDGAGADAQACMRPLRRLDEYRPARQSGGDRLLVVREGGEGINIVAGRPPAADGDSIEDAPCKQRTHASGPLSKVSMASPAPVPPIVSGAWREGGAEPASVVCPFDRQRGGSWPA